VSIESSALSFLHLYLGPFLPQKPLELLKLSLLKKSQKARLKDPALADVTLIRSVVETLKKRRKGVIAQLNPLNIENQTFLELLKLPPDEALLLCSSTLFPIPTASLSMALNRPEASLSYRQAQILAHFDEQGLALSSLIIEIDPKTLKPSPLRVQHQGVVASIQALPTGLRFLIETCIVLVFLLGLLWVIPEVRNRYETSIQKRINDYLIESSLVDSPAPDGTSKAPRIVPATPLEPAEDEEPITKSSSEAPSQKRQPRVNEGETWRFSFTGSGTSEIEQAILDVLKKLGAESPKPINVPGGIQFDLILEVENLLKLKGQLETATTGLQKKTLSNPTATSTFANMSWYKKKNMGTRKVPSAHVQVIIWISTL
jgi:hypothetical protein